MSFDERLKKAIERGQRRQETRQREEAARAMSEEELRRIHTQHRLALSEHIEKCVQKLVGYFPGFRAETIYGERGWGAACSRDDFRVSSQGRRENNYSRFEMTIRPFSALQVVELTAKATIANKELFNRTYFERIEEADASKFRELIDNWVVEYAELYTAR